MITCPRCATLNPAGFRFCGNCAAPLDVAAAPAAERRKVVTVLFSDVVESTRLGEQRDPETMRTVMARYFEVVRRVLERHGGTVEKFIGDAVMAVFGHPLLHEDDALRAVRAADELRTALAALNTELEHGWGITIQTRTGINTGPVVAGEDGLAETLVTGDAVNVAARLQTAAEPGETYIGADTYALVRDAVTVEQLPPFALKGKDLRVDAWRLISVEADALGHARHLDSALVGREREQRLLAQAFEEAASDHTCVLFTLLGPAGVGKSRLVHEFLSDAGGRARVLRGRCLPYGDGITFWPLAEIVRQAAGITDADTADAAREKLERLLPDDEQRAVIARDVGAAIGLGEREASAEEIFWATRRFLELLAAQQPLVVVLDDIHWGEPTLFELIEHVADWSRDAPIMMLCVARPELLEARPTWAGGKLHATTLLLQPLPADQVSLLVHNLLGEGALAETLVRRIADAAEGNPLFVEEFVAVLIDDGLLRRDDGRWVPTGDLERVTVPPTIRSLLAARIDRLERRERSVIERASVVGKVFWQGAIAELAPASLAADVRQSLLGLVRKELVRPDRSDFAGDEAYRFRHLLLRDAAYEGLPKQDRGQLHEQFAGWLERTAGDRIAEYEEVLGYHLEQAHRYRSELAPFDDAATGLGLRAARLLASAGLRAADRGDVAAARKLLERALRLFPADHAERPDLLLALVEPTVETGDLEAAQEVLGQTIREAEHSGNRSALWRARLYRNELRFRLDPDGAVAEGLEIIERAQPVLAEIGDHLGLAHAWAALHGTRYYLGDLAGARAAARSMLEHARLAGSERNELDALISKAAMGVWDDTPVDAALAEAEEALSRARAAGRRLHEAQAMGIKARVISMTGRYEEATRLVDQARAILHDLGRRTHAAGATHWGGVVGWFAGDPASAARVLREGADELDRVGEKPMLSSSLGDLAVALAKQGRFGEALAASTRAEELAAADDVAAQISWRIGRALALAGLGKDEEAGGLAREALDIADQRGYPLMRASARVDLADVIGRALGEQEAARALGAARAYFARKGALPVVERIDAQLERLTARGLAEAQGSG